MDFENVVSDIIHSYIKPDFPILKVAYIIHSLLYNDDGEEYLDSDICHAIMEVRDDKSDDVYVGRKHTKHMKSRVYTEFKKNKFYNENTPFYSITIVNIHRIA
tara:strand:- start:1249 stop:1557 length:309 start_codon:yes stop_codon:yes gene_type:complete